MIRFFNSTILGAGAVPPTPNTKELLLWFWGESNSGGMALNEDALPSEIGERANVNIYRNNFVRQIAPLYIGGVNANNLIGHTGFTTEQTQTMHGWELQFANKVDANYFLKSPCYLVKTGQGGSRIAQWAEGQTYTNTCISRVNGMKFVLNNQGAQHETYMIATIGINDAVAGTSATDYYNGVVDFIARMRALYGDFNIIMTRIMRYNANYQAIDDAIVQLGNDFSYITVVSVDGAELENAQHWSYSGMKLIADRMLKIVRDKYLNV